MALHMKKTHNILQGYLLIAPLLLGCLLFYAIPFILVIQYSLSTGSGDALYFIGFINYQDVTTNGMFTLAFGNTMRFLAAALPLIMALAYAIALLVQKHANKHKLLKSVFLFPYIMPVVGAVILVELLFADSGLVPSVADALGLPLVDWLGGPAAFGVVLLLYLWKNTGYSVILLLAGLVTIPEEQYSAADLDGASGWQKFFYITTPQMWYSVFFAIIFSLINAFKCFREIFLIGGTHPNENIYMLQHFLNNSFVPLGTFILTQSFKSVSDDIIDAAKLDGCGLFRLLTKIILPMNTSGLVCVTLLSFLDGWNMVEQPIAYIKDFLRYPLSVALAYVPPADPTLQLVCCILVVLPPLFLFTYFNRELVEGIVLAEVK